jgi:hypothetical protein
MRLERLEFDVNRQYEGIVDDVMAVPCGNVDVLPPEPEHHGRAFGRIVREVEAYRGSHLLRFSTRLHVNLDDQIAGRLEHPCHSLRQQRRNLPRSPAEKVAIWKYGRSENDAVVARIRIAFVELARRARRIDPDVGMMDDARISRMELEPLDVPARARRQRQNEHARHIDTVGRQLIRNRKRDDEIGFPELPACGPRRHWQRPRIAFGDAARHPSID